MFQVTAPIPDDWADALEEHFLGEVRSCWSLLKVNRDTPTLLSGYFDSAAEGRAAWDGLRGTFPDLAAEPEVVRLDDRDWQEAYKAFLKPWSYRDLHWVPLWMRDEYGLPEGAHAVYLDAGMAFGTGSHETTRLCAIELIRFRDEHAESRSGLRVVDAGCGSGILAVSADLFGFGSVHGFDHDPESLPVARENAEANGAARATFAVAGIEEGMRGRTADLLLANIQSDVLTIYADELIAGVAASGWLVLSGILVGQMDEVREHYAQQIAAAGRRAEVRTATMGEWCSVTWMFG